MVTPRWVGVLLTALTLVVVAACGVPASRDLAELVVRDSLYLDSATWTPFSGPVHRTFPDDPTITQLEGELLDGVWEGELRVYHPNGRIRYMGSFAGGERCGPWTENADSTHPGSVYDELLREVESMGLYPTCGSDLEGRRR